MLFKMLVLLHFLKIEGDTEELYGALRRVKRCGLACA